MREYLRVLELALDGNRCEAGRNIPDTTAAFAVTFRHEMKYGYPLLTTKKVNWRYVLYELFWFLSGEEKPDKLNEVCPIWKPWTAADGTVPSPYGYFWGDQLHVAIEGLKTNPYSRRYVVSAWEPSNALYSSLPPCHFAFVLNRKPSGLNLHVTMRSCDVPIGLPYNIASYGALLKIICHIVGCTPGTLAITMVDCHIYDNQRELVYGQLGREPGRLPELAITGGRVLEDYMEMDSIKHFDLEGYYPYAHIPYKVSV